MGEKATASSQSVLSSAPTRRSRAVTPTGAAGAQALGGSRAEIDGEEPVPASEVHPLIQRNQSVGFLLSEAFTKKKLIVQDKDLRQVQELAACGSFKFEGRTVCCLCVELLDLLEALITSDEVQKQGHPLGILSLIREPGKWDFDRERAPNHGRMLPASEHMTDFKGRTVVALSSAVDLSAFAGYRIRMVGMGPSKGATLTDAHRAAIRAQKAGISKAVAGILRHLPMGPGRRYTLGLPRPVGADQLLLLPPEYAKTGTLPNDFKYPEDTCHVFLLPHPKDKPVSPTHGYRGDVKLIINKEAREAMIAALTAAGLHDAKANQRPEPPSTGIIVLVPDGKDHLHITTHRASDDLTRPKAKKDEQD